MRWLAFVCVSGAMQPASAATCPALDQSHAAWTTLLKAHVRDGVVDYAGLNKKRSQLQAYTKSLAGICKADFAKYTSQQKLAYWINTYNTYMIELILENYPLDSVRQIGLLPFAAFKEDFIPDPTHDGASISLNDVEHKRIRENFDEPRIHFAVVCASKSCPALRSEAFRAADLDRQLDEQARGFINDARRNRFDNKAKKLELSEIFKWYKKDFTKPGRSLAQYILPYVADERRGNTQAKDVEVSYIDYDWTLNGK